MKRSRILKVIDRFDMTHYDIESSFCPVFMKQDADRFIQDSFTNGTVFDGKYRIDGLIGTGNFSHVFKARHESMGRDVALKILKPEMKRADPGLSVRFMNEVKIVSKLRHPNSVTIFDFGETEGIQYMVLEYIPGTDLDQILKEKKRFPAKIAIDLVLQILSALEEAHHHNIIHRDLKPSNIMISKAKGTGEKRKKPVLKVLDFGVAKVVAQPKASKNQSQRRSTKFIGTPVYMSPEQVLGQHVSAASDLYSVGLILYEILTGDVPVVAKNLAGVAQIHIDEAPIPFQKIHQLPKPLQSIIFTATQRFPEDRFSNAMAFADALRGLKNGGTHKRLDEVSESTRAFFLERDESKGEIPMMAKSHSSPAAKRVKRPAAKPASTRPTPSDEIELELDMKKVRAMERSKTQRQVAIQPIDTGRGATDWIPFGVGFLAFFFCAGLMGTLLPTDSVPLRFLLSLSPILIGTLATSFSPIARKNSDNFIEHWIEPILQRSIPLFLLIVIVAAIVFPEHAALACRDHATWFLPEPLKMGIFGNVVNSIGSLFATLFSVASKILPW